MPIATIHLPLDGPRIEASLPTRHFGHPLYVLPSTGSTNDAARELADAGAPEGAVVVAEEQSAGRGRMGRHWVAPRGSSLLLSILFRPDLPAAQGHLLTMLCSLASVEAVEQVCGLRADLKWPNDVLVLSGSREGRGSRPRKLAGILTETALLGERLHYAIVGVGLNVNVAPADLPHLAPDATSLLAELGRPVDRAALLAALLAGVETRYDQLRAGHSPRAAWQARLSTLGQAVNVTTAGGVVSGVAESVDEDGALRVRSADGTLQRITAGDVTLRA